MKPHPALVTWLRTLVRLTGAHPLASFNLDTKYLARVVAKRVTN